MFYVLFVICLYISTYIGISMLVANLKYKPPDRYIKWFPILRIYLCYRLFKIRKYNTIFSRKSTLILLVTLGKISYDLKWHELFSIVRMVSYKI